MYIINSIDEVEYCLKRGFNPLLWNNNIKVDIIVRKQAENALFGKTSLGKGAKIIANSKYYKYSFENSLKICVNCGEPLYKKKNIDVCYSAVNVSHILTRGAHPEMAHDLRNHNILCFDCHQKWEGPEKHTMLIYLDNRIIINELMLDYQKIY